MKRIVYALDLVDEAAALAAYDEAHRVGGPPRAVTANIRAAGVHEMEIFRSANRLVMIVAAGDDFAGLDEGGSDDAAIRDWDRAMRALQRTIPGGDADGWSEMRQVYRLTDQP